MDWEQYKRQVRASREILVFPFFKEKLQSLHGMGIDIGCGDGDLTEYLASELSVRVLGIDNSKESLELARSRTKGQTHYVLGDIEKNVIQSLGVTFDFAMSNCCLQHISDEAVYRVLMDLHSCMRSGGILALLVPSADWAARMYADIDYNGAGLTAVPSYGGRQWFRIPEWYASALKKCGFSVIENAEVRIPDNELLEQRYLENIGRPLFSAFIAERAESIPNLESIQKAFDVAHENRKLEIQLFWQRSLFFWGFVAAALVGYGTAYNKEPRLALAFALFGLVCSVVWSAGNRGSKYWQQYWEDKVNFLQHYTTGNIFFDRAPKKPSLLDNYSARRISVSKLTMALSDYMVLLWLSICVLALRPRLPPEVLDYLPAAGVVLTLCYCLLFLRNVKSED